MATLPKQLRVGWMTYKVSYGYEECEAVNSNGHFQEDLRRIVIRTGLVPDTEREVVLHEVMHAVFVAAHIDLSDEQEETLVDSIAGPLLDVLRSNPALTTFLLAKE